MIYLDNAATTLHKPPEVAEAVKNAILTAGNAARGAHGASLSASRMVFETRSRQAELFGCPRADHVVFTANSTEALNIAVYGLISAGDHVILGAVVANVVSWGIASINGMIVAAVCYLIGHARKNR